MKEHVRRGLCARCRRPASVEVVYQPRARDGSPVEPVAERYCDRHRPADADALVMQVRTLGAVGSPAGRRPRRGAVWRRPRFSVRRTSRTPPSRSDERPTGSLRRD
jgi:hypothetical protein